MPSIRMIVLDAMGVIFRVADDVQELLIPFIRKHNLSVSADVIQQRYYQCSLGLLSSEAFWKSFGLPKEELEDDYLRGHRLTPGTLDFLSAMRARGFKLSCLSNDVAEWSRKLRRLHHLDEQISQWTISGEVGSRKPCPEIYRYHLDIIDTAPEDCVFIDDRVANLNTAMDLGMRTLRYCTGDSHQSGRHLSVSSFPEVEMWIGKSFHNL